MVRTFDKDYIKYLYSLEDMYNRTTDDYAPSFEDFIPDTSPSKHHWVIVLNENKVAGMFRADNLGTHVYQTHIFIFKDHLHKSYEIGVKFLEYIKFFGRATSLIAIVGEHVPQVGPYIEKLGAKKVSTLHDSVYKNKTVYDQHLYTLEV